MQNIVYGYGDALYINLTNRCSNACVFCIRNFRDGVSDDPLWLDREPTAEEVIAELERRGAVKTGKVVFCGFGEPTCALGVLTEVAAYLKNRGVMTRINTNGQSDLINGEAHTARRLKGLIDTVNVVMSVVDCIGEKEIEACRKVAESVGARFRVRVMVEDEN